MLSWIGANLATILITLVLAKVVVGILVICGRTRKKRNPPVTADFVRWAAPATNH